MSAKLHMELNCNQQQSIRESLQKLSALANVIGYICEAGVPCDDVFMGWELLLLDIEQEIHQIIEPGTARIKTEEQPE